MGQKFKPPHTRQRSNGIRKSKIFKEQKSETKEFKPSQSRTSPVIESPAQSPDEKSASDQPTNVSDFDLNISPPVRYSIARRNALSRSRSASANSIGSDRQSFSHSESEAVVDLQKEINAHLERQNDQSMQQRNVRSDSLMPSELKKRYRSKLK